MAQVHEFPDNADPLPRHSHHAKRTLESKCQEIAQRSPSDRAALDTLADVVLARLNHTQKAG